MKGWWWQLPPGERILLLIAIAFLVGGIFGFTTAPYAVVPR